MKKDKQKPPLLTVELNWTGELPGKLKAQLKSQIAKAIKAINTPHKFTFKIPSL